MLMHLVYWSNLMIVIMEANINDSYVEFNRLCILAWNPTQLDPFRNSFTRMWLR